MIECLVKYRSVVIHICYFDTKLSKIRSASILELNGKDIVVSYFPVQILADSNFTSSRIDSK